MNLKQQSELKDKKLSILQAINLNQYENHPKEEQEPKDKEKWQDKLYQILQSNFLDNSSLGTSQEERIFQHPKDLDFLI